MIAIKTTVTIVEDAITGYYWVKVKVLDDLIASLCVESVSIEKGDFYKAVRTPQGLIYADVITQRTVPKQDREEDSDD